MIDRQVHSVGLQLYDDDDDGSSQLVTFNYDYENPTLERHQPGKKNHFYSGRMVITGYYRGYV